MSRTRSVNGFDGQKKAAGSLMSKVSLRRFPPQGRSSRLAGMERRERVFPLRVSASPLEPLPAGFTVLMASGVDFRFHEES